MSGVGQLVAQGVTLRLSGRPVLHAVDLQISRGWTALIGLNGAGKSSLLRVLAGLQRPDTGQVWLENRPLWPASPAQAPGRALTLERRERARRIAWLSQQSDTTGDLTLRETVALGRIPQRGLAGAWQPEDERAIDEAVALTACGTWQHRRMHSLSGGERQRALLARALATGADVLLLDEPTTHLDPPHQVALARLARRLSATHTLVSVVHDLALALMADRIILLASGCVLAQGSVGDKALHRAIEANFQDAVRIERCLDGDWLARAQR